MNEMDSKMAGLVLSISVLVNRSPDGILRFSKEELHSEPTYRELAMKKTSEGGLEIWLEDQVKQ